MERMDSQMQDLVEAWAEWEVEAFAQEPPDWAQDPFNHNMAERCGHCGAWCSVVRPGKTQCDNPECDTNGT